MVKHGKAVGKWYEMHSDAFRDPEKGNVEDALMAEHEKFA